MNSAKFYNDSSAAYYVTAFGDEYAAARVKQVPAADLISNKLCDPYVMGYVSAENFPAQFALNSASSDIDGKVIHFNNIMRETNFGWGFCNQGTHSNSYPYLVGITNANAYYDCNPYPNSDVALLLNKTKMCNVVHRVDSLRLYIKGVIMPVDEEPDDDGILFSNSDSRLVSPTNPITINITDYQNIVGTMDSDNPTKVTFSITFDGASRTFSFSDNDFNSSNVAKLYDSNNDYVIYIIIINIDFGGNGTICDYAYSSNSSGNTYITPFFRIPLTDDNTANLNTDICAMYIPAMGGINSYSYDKRFYYYTESQTIALGSGSTSNLIFAGYHVGCFPYDIDLDELQSFDNFGANKIGVIYGKYILDQTGSGSGYYGYRIYSQCRLIDGWKMYSFYHKTRVPNQTYSTSDYFKYNGLFSVSLFDENNTPLHERERTISTVAAMYEKLQPWQKLGADITIDEFTVDDIPEWTPPEPTNDGENIGDSVTRPATLGIGGTNGFVTQYAMRATDIQELGQILWTSVFDSDYWQNYMFSLALDTGSFSMSALLSFFVSLKVYPFALVNVPSYTPIGKNMYVGTGIHALEFTNNLHTINNYCDYISGGVCTVWSDNFYSDYRDYINASYTLYVPYCGTIQLNPGDVVRNTLKVQYAVDFATGGCVAYVDVYSWDGKRFTIAALPGQMGADVPLTATAAGAVASRFVGDAMKFGGLISGEIGNVAGGIVAGMSGQKPGGGSGNVLSGMAGMIGGLPAAVGMDLAPGFAMQAANMFSRGAVSAPMMSGGQGFASFGAPQKPYVQIRRGLYPKITNLENVCGYVSAGTYTIGDLSGFVQGDIKTDGLNCPENEKMQIRQLIAKGIYV